MKNLSFKKSFCLLLFVVFFSKSFAITHSEQEYYKGHKWDFMEKVFVNDVCKMRTHYDKYPWMVVLLPEIALFYTLFFSHLVNGDKFETKLGCFLSINVFFVYPIILGYLFTKNVCLPKKIKTNLLKQLEYFLQNYSADKDAKLDVNFRNLLPEEYLSVFDAMHEDYVKNGKTFFENFLDVLYKIREQIFYEIKSEKYTALTIRHKKA